MATRNTRGRRMLALALSAAALFSGCATADPGAALRSPAVTSTPTVACPAMEGVELPADCAPYDPEAAMAANDRHRERMALDEGAAQANRGAVGAVRSALEALRASGEVTADAVQDVLETKGIRDVQIRDDHSRVLFGASGPGGGCLFGEVDESTVSVETGGYILDGGCLPAN